MVVPVLHGVTVSSVKQQIAVLKSSSSVNQVPTWPRVLLESDVLQGHVYDDEQSESKFMEEIAKDVFEKLYPTEEIGIYRRQLAIENLLCKQPWGLRSIGISGEPGIGKTTLARAVFRRISGGYDVSRFIKDFHKEYSEKES
ncbi:hypothetical protein EUTSA_v10001065mg [Eutrema salsugineum]|uniref:NB-ARC domain-containing protein n=1 Tax=Eutrema salsugineum TaxID=72664 RepID=V4L7M0_EUTSA|nr:hypothetical protein EUTSA_v10001065mg [Eutrema salsugineum]